MSSSQAIATRSSVGETAMLGSTCEVDAATGKVEFGTSAGPRVPDVPALSAGAASDVVGSSLGIESTAVAGAVPTSSSVSIAVVVSG